MHGVRTERIRAAASATALAQEATRATGGLAAVQLAREAQVSGGVHSAPMTEAQAGAFAMVLNTVLDPVTMIGALQARLRDNNAELEEAGAADAAQRSEFANREQMHMLEKAQRALRKKARGMGRFAKKLLGAILTIVGTVASVFTGGASVALTVIGAVLLLAGEIVEVMAEKGILDERNGGIAAMVLKLVGAVVQTVASFGASAGSAVNAVKNVSETVVKAAQITKQIVDYVMNTLSTINGAIDMHNAVRQYQADDANIDAHAAGDNAENANEDLAQHADELRRIQQRFARVIAKVRATIEAQNEAAQAALHSFA